MNAQKQCLSNRSLSVWLLSNMTTSPDIVAIGFQELVNLSGKEVAKDLAEIEGYLIFVAPFFKSFFILQDDEDSC